MEMPRQLRLALMRPRITGQRELQKEELTPRSGGFPQRRLPMPPIGARPSPADCRASRRTENASQIFTLTQPPASGGTSKRVTKCGPAFSHQSAAPPELSFAKRVTQPDDLWSSTPLELLLKRVTETRRHDALAGSASIANWRTPMREAFAL